MCRSSLSCPTCNSDKSAAPGYMLFNRRTAFKSVLHCPYSPDIRIGESVAKLVRSESLRTLQRPESMPIRPMSQGDQVIAHTQRSTPPPRDNKLRATGQHLGNECVHPSNMWKRTTMHWYRHLGSSTMLFRKQPWLPLQYTTTTSVVSAEPYEKRHHEKDRVSPGVAVPWLWGGCRHCCFSTAPSNMSINSLCRVVWLCKERSWLPNFAESTEI